MTVGRDRWLALVAVGAAGAVWFWLPHVYFYADDFMHLYDAVNLSPLAFALQPHGGHLYVVRNLVLDLTLALAGPEPEWFMATVLATHLLNVWLLFLVIRRFTGSGLLACLGALVWGTVPDAVATLGWYSVYGQVLATTVMLAVLASAGGYAEQHRVPPTRTVLGWVVLACAGATCFGTGLAFGAVLPIVVALLVPDVWHDRRTRVLLLAAPIGVVAMYLVVPAVHAWLDPLRSEASVSRFVLVDLWSEWSVGRLLRGLGALLSRGLVGLVALSARAMPGLAVPALLLWLAACGLCLRHGTGAERRRLLGFLVVTTAAYAAVVVGRVFSDLVETEPRYHYYAQAPLVVTLCLVAARGVADRSSARWLELAGVVTMAIMLVALRGSFDEDRQPLRTGRRLKDGFFDAAVQDMVAQQPGGAVLHLGNDPITVSFYQIPKVRLPGYAALFCILHPDGLVAGRPVRFVEPDPEVLAAAAGGRCSARVVVAAPPPGTSAVPVPKPPDFGRLPPPR
jgi:hypothetical protein